MENGDNESEEEQISDAGENIPGEGQLECTHVCSIESGCMAEISDCRHEHDEECGYREAAEGQPCSYVCRICPLEELMDALPEQVTEENREEIVGQLAMVLEKYQELTQEEQEQVDLSRYEEIRAMMEQDAVSGQNEELPAIPEQDGELPAIPDENNEEFAMPYYLFIVHSLNVNDKQYGSTELIELSADDLTEDPYDLHKHVLEKEGMKTVRASYLDKETYDLTEGWTVSLSDFEQAGDPEDGSGYYAVQAVIEYEVAQGYQAIVSDHPSPADDPYGIMPLVGFIGGNIADITFEPANIVNIKVQYMYSPTGGLAGMAAAESRQYQVVVEQGKEVEEQWDIPYADGTSYQNLEGFRIVLDPKPLNAFLVDPALADEMTDHLDVQKVQDAMENDRFTIDTAKDVYRAGLAAGGEYGNIYSDRYNQAWNSARSITAENGLYTAKAASENYIGDRGEGANPLKAPKLTVNIPAEQTSIILTKLEAISGAGSTAEKERLQKELDDILTITVYYRRNAGVYQVAHWVSNLPADQQTGKEKQLKDGVAYYKVYEESKQGRIGATTNAVPGMDLMEKEGIDNWIADGGFDFTSYVTEGFGQKIIEPGDQTKIDIFYKPASAYRIIFNTDDTYITRVQADLNDTLIFNYGAASLSVKNTEGKSRTEENYRNPSRIGYQFEGWRYEVVAGSGIAGAYEEDGKWYVDITDEFKIDETHINQKLLVLANDTDSTVRAIYLYPRWTSGRANVRVVFWTEDLSGHEKDAKVSAENAPVDYTDRFGAYMAGTPDEVGGSFSNAGNFSFMATAGQVLDLSVARNGFIDNNSDRFTVEDDALDSSINGTLAELIDAMFQVRMPEVATSSGSVPSCQFYHPYQVNKNASAKIKVVADGSTVINVYYARNVYSVDFTYYGIPRSGRISIAYTTNGYSLLDNPSDYNSDTASSTASTGRNKWRDVTEDITQIVPEKLTITAKYGADLKDIWPNSQGETIGIRALGGFRSATFISWATTAGPYNARYKAAFGKDSNTDIEPTLMGIYGAMSADIIANPEDTGVVHHMYGYWWHRYISYYRFNHCYEVPGLTQRELLDAGGVETFDLRLREFGNDDDNRAHEMTVTAEEADRRNTIYLVPVQGGSLAGYFEDYRASLAKVDRNGRIDEKGQYYAVRCYEGNVYALAKQVDALSSDTIGRQHPSARMNLTRVNSTADHDTRTSDGDGNGNSDVTLGSSDKPYDLFFYYDRDRFTITYMVPARDSAIGEYTLGTREAPFGSVLSRYKVVLDNRNNRIKKFYSDNNAFRDFWVPSAGNKGLGESANSNGYARVIPNSAVNGTGIWKFDGWTLDRSNSEKMDDAHWNDVVSGDLRLFANWEAPNYKVTFKMEGGVVSGGSSADVVYTDICANQGFTSSGNAIPRPIKNGYTLAGWKWYKDGEIPTPVEDFTFETPIIQDMVVVADWTVFQAKKYNYKVWYLTNDPDAVRKTGEGWIEEKESGSPGKDTKPPAGLAGEGYTYVLGCEFFSQQKYPEGTSLLLKAKRFEGYIPYNGNAAIELKKENPYDTAGNTNYVAYFYYDKAKMKKYEIRFQPVKISDGSDDGDLLAGILQEGETDKAYFTPSNESFQALKEAGYQLVQMNRDGTVVMEGGEPKAARSFGELGDFIEERNQEFAEWDHEEAMEITFKVMPIPYTITYGVGTLKADGKEVNGSGKLIDAMENQLKGLENKENGGAVSGDEFQNPTAYYVSNFKDNFSFTLKNPVYVQNPDDESEWWKFIGWSTGDGTTEMNTTRSSTGGEYPLLTIHRSVGNLLFLANWERVNTGVAVLDIDFEKQLNGRGFQAGDSFAFTLTASEGAPAPKNENGLDANEVTIAPESGNCADVPFGRFFFEKEGVYKYTLEEQPGNAYGMIYDTQPKTLTITVSKEGGQLTAAADVTNIKWTNTYIDSGQGSGDTEEKNGEGSADRSGTGKDSDMSADTDNTSGGKLPQTGMPWRPVWILAIIGVAMLVIGIVRKKESRDYHEE